MPPAKQDNKDTIGSDFNMQILSTEELETHLGASIQYGSCVLVVGNRGTGKTDITQQQIALSKFEQIYLNLSTKERVDIGGYPNLFNAGNEEYISHRLPSFYKKLVLGDQKAVLVLDEADKADSSLLSPLLEIVQERTIDGKPLNNLHAIIMTGNLISEGGSKPPPPLLDRCEKYLVRANSISWLKWAARFGSNIHPSVYAFITDYGQWLVPETTQDERYSDKSPRGWENVSKIVHYGEQQKWSDIFINQKVCGYVGHDAGEQFKNYFLHYKNIIPTIDKVFEGRHDAALSEYKSWSANSWRIIASMIAASRLVSLIESNKTPELAKNKEAIRNVGKFFSSIDNQNAYIATRGLIGKERIVPWGLMKEECWGPLITQINEILLKS